MEARSFDPRAPLRPVADARLVAHKQAVNRFRAIFLLLIGLLAEATPASATSTICSNPRRAGIRATMSVALPSAGAAQLEEQIKAIAESRLGMNTAGTAFEDPSETPVLRERDLILQSPDVSVVITISTSNRSNRARIRVERTCYYDAQVPWRPYWRNLRTFLRESGYRLERR